MLSQASRRSNLARSAPQAIASRSFVLPIRCDLHFIVRVGVNKVSVIAELD